MNRAVHVTTGLTFMALLTVRYPTGTVIHDIPVLPAIGIATSILGSTVPDLDLKPMHWTRGKKGIKRKLARVAQRSVNEVTGAHRGLFHSFLMLLIPLSLWLFTHSTLSRFHGLALVFGSAFFGVFMGMALHVFADMFNGKGVALFYPISRSKISIMDFPSEGFMPWLWYLLFTCISTCIFFRKELLEWLSTLF